ncbi:MAG: endolytic transglycosylase MltG [Actinomycetota bacterium]|nr:endolytic transglycosylase MltG [Actinomycetota bacterium]
MKLRPPGRVLLAVAGLAAVVALVGGVWLARQLDPPGPPGAKMRVAIQPGTSVAGIADILEREGVLTSSRVFRLYLKAKGAESFQAGEYELRRRMAMGAALTALQDGPEVVFSKLIIPEGFTLTEMADVVGKLPGRSGERFLELARAGTIRSKWQPSSVSTLEGLLFPDTYLVTDREDEAAIIRRLVARFDDVATDVGLAEGPRPAGLDPYQTIVAASLVETEGKVPDDRPLIASVIENRLERGMKLQIDATVLYALGRHKSRVLFKDLEVDSPYNTYKVDGLPPTPIGAPGKASLEAMLHPADEDYLYYVLIDKDGRHAFARTPAEFERLKAESRRKGVR